MITRSIQRAATASALLCAVASVVTAQSTATIQVSAEAVVTMSGDACQYTASRRAPLESAKIAGDELAIEIYRDGTLETRDHLFVPLEIRFETKRVAIMPKDSSTFHVHAGPAGLLETRVTLWTPNSTVPLCVVQPFPRPPSFAQFRPFTTHTDIIASGEVLNALKTGTENTSETGSLGFHHQAFSDPARTPTRFPWVFLRDRPRGNSVGGIAGRVLHFLSFPLSGEDLRAVVSVAGTTDSITGPPGGGFAQAVLLPSSAPKAAWKSVDLGYFPFWMTPRTHQMIGPAFRLVAAESRWAPDSVAKTKIAVLVAFDARLRLVLINRVSDEDDNSLSFAIDGGYIRRTIGGDASDAAYTKAALGDTRTRFNGWAVGTYMRLRQVTAFADFQCLSCRFLWKKGRDGEKIESLEGLQPVIGFRFEAPFFTVPE